MKSFMLALSLLVLHLSLGCASGVPLANASSPSGPVEVTLDRESDLVRFALGDSAYRIHLRQITDSRCPANAQCIWQGELAAELDVDRERSGARESKQLTLGELTSPSVTIVGASFELVSISETSVSIRVKAE